MTKSPETDRRPPVRAAQPRPARWDAVAHARWERGERQAAIDLLLAQINGAAPARRRDPGLQLCYYVYLLGDLAAAEHFLEELLKHSPDDLVIVENLAVCLNRQAKYVRAVPLFARVCEEQPGSVNAWDGLAHGLGGLGAMARAREAGERALELKDRAARPLPGLRLPARVAVPAGARHVIAFSLWGSEQRYLRGALRNLLLIPELYPGWTARLYIDGSVPEGFATVAASLGAQVIREADGQTLRQKLCWRFQVASDPGVGRFLVRDCDSVIGRREVRAVDEWLASDRCFHVMRDWHTHTDPVLAGMWGGIAGVLPDPARLLARYRPPTPDTANVDQWFLREMLWDGIRRSVLVHDRCFRLEGSRPWPDADPPDNVHVGQDEFVARPQHQAAWLSAWIEQCSWLRA